MFSKFDHEFVCSIRHYAHIEHYAQVEHWAQLEHCAQVKQYTRFTIIGMPQLTCS